MSFFLKNAATIVLMLLCAAATLISTACETGPDLSNVNRPARANSNKGPAEQELSGEYKLTGLDENGSNPFEGIISISNQGNAYKFVRQTNRARYTGVGIQNGDDVGVIYAEGDQGKGCGVVLYKIAPDGSLDGRIAKWGEYTSGAEKAVRTAGNTFAGSYSVEGTASDGKAYSGTIKIDKMGDGFFVTWTTSVVNIVGFGIWRGDRAAIGFGGKQCTFAIYKVLSAKSLEGHWGSQRTITFGTETAKKD